MVYVVLFVVLRKYFIYIYAVSFALFAFEISAQISEEELFEENSSGYVTHQEEHSDFSDNQAEAKVFTPDTRYSEADNELIKSVILGDNDKARAFLMQGADPNIAYNISKDNNTVKDVPLIHFAVAARNQYIAEVLLGTPKIDVNKAGFVTLENGADKYDALMTPLAYAVYLNHMDMAKLLLSKGADPNLNCGGLVPAIFFASDAEAIKLLKKYKADINITNSNGDTPLSASLMRNDGMLTTALMKNGADVNKKDGRGNTPLYLAVFLGYFNIARFFIDAGADLNAVSGEDKVTPLMAAVSRSDRDIGFLRYMLFKGADIDKRDKNGKYPIFHIDGFSDKDIGRVKETVALLLENGADINAQDNNGNSVLHLHGGFYYQLYSSFKPDVNIRNKNGDTPLHIAAKEGDVASLLTGSPDKTIKNNQGKTALALAEENNNAEAVSMLKLPQKDYLLMAGAVRGDISLVKKALAMKPDINNAILGTLPIVYASQGGSAEVFTTLIKNGADISLAPDLIYEVINSFSGDKDQGERVKFALLFIDNQAEGNWEKYNNILHILASEQCVENRGSGFIRDVMERALEKGADPNYLDNAGRTPLHITSSGIHACYDLTLSLISRGADPDIADNSGRTPLRNAAMLPADKADDFISLLNGSKSDINAADTMTGNTLLMDAGLNGNRMIVMILVARGADDGIVNKSGKTALDLAKEKFEKTAETDDKYGDYKYLAEKFLSDKNAVAECRSGINEECKKYYKPVDVIKTDELAAPQ